MASKLEIKGLFDRASSTYDAIGPQFFSFFGQKLVTFSGLRPGSSVLDIATGRGAIVFAAAQAAPLKRIVGVDLSEAMVLQTKKDADARSSNHIEILRMDAENLDFSDGSFDYIFCGFALFFFPDPNRALMEISRVLKTGGALCVSSWTKTDDRRKWLIELVKEHLPMEADFNEALRLLPKGFDNEEKISDAMRKVGLTPNKSCIKTMEISYKTAQEWWNAQYSHGIRSIFETIEIKTGRDGLARFKKDIFNRIRSMQINGEFKQTLKAILVKASK